MSKPHFFSEDDLELLAQQFWITDPENVPNLVDRLPPELNHLTILAKYDISAQKPPRLRCAHCGGRKHWRGYLLQLPDGQHALLAERHCGREQFGLKWNQVENEFLGRMSRQSDLRRLVEIRRSFPAFLDEIIALLDRPELKEFDRYLHDLGHQFGPLAKALGNGPKRDGRFEAIIHLRDPDAEERQARKREPKFFEAIEKAENGRERARAERDLQKWINENGRVFRPHREPMGFCAGYQILNLAKPYRLVEDASKEAQRLALPLAQRESNEWTAATLRLAFQSLRQISENLAAAVELVTQLNRFTTPTNLEAVAAWATRDETTDAKFRVSGRTLIDSNGRELKAPMLAPIETPILDTIVRASGKK